MYLNNRIVRYQQSKLPFNFWAYVQGLLPDEKLMLSYLYTSSFTNRLGCFQIDPNSIQSALSYSDEAFTKACYFLQKKGYIKFDYLRNWIYLPHFLVYFPVRNPNQGKHIEELFYQVPSECDFYFDLIHQLLLVNHLQKSFRKNLKHSLYRWFEVKAAKENK